MSKPDAVPRIHAETRAQWRAWLIEHHGTAAAVWLVSWKKSAGRPSLAYDDAVTEALAFGWVDSRPGKLDDDRTMLYFSPRKPRSGWSRPNKQRVDGLLGDALMTPAGQAVVDAAKADGSWTLLDEVEDLIIPPDLASALDAIDDARKNWDGFPRSARRGILEWIVQARRPATRAKRIQTTTEQAGRGQRANQWTPKGN